MKILVVADFEEGRLRASTGAAVAAALSVGAPVDLLVAGKGAGQAAPEARYAGVSRVIAVDGDELEHLSCEGLASQVLAQCGEYSHVFFALGFLNRAAMPQVAASLGVSPLTEISAVLDERTFKRSIYAGAAVITVKATAGRPVVATVRTTAFDAPAGDGSPEIVSAPPAAFPQSSAFVSREVTKSDRPDLLTARRVVSGGQGLEDEEGFALLGALADRLGAAVGATRAVVDSGLAPNEWQVGQTGKIVAPDLYIAFGISGALQHLAGMMGSKVIVAVNKDPEAPIFEVADYGLVADAKAAADELAKSL